MLVVTSFFQLFGTGLGICLVVGIDIEMGVGMGFGMTGDSVVNIFYYILCGVVNTS